MEDCTIDTQRVAETDRTLELLWVLYDREYLRHAMSCPAVSIVSNQREGEFSTLDVTA